MSSKSLVLWSQLSSSLSIEINRSDNWASMEKKEKIYVVAFQYVFFQFHTNRVRGEDGGAHRIIIDRMGKHGSLFGFISK